MIQHLTPDTSLGIRLKRSTYVRLISMKCFHKSMKACLVQISMVDILVDLAFSLEFLHMQIYKRGMFSQEMIEFFLSVGAFKRVVGHDFIIPGYNMSRGTIG